MTRINLIPVQELADQHLLAEYRELPRVFGSVRTHAQNKKTTKDFNIRKEFILGNGHCTFFYDKLYYLQQRHICIVQECIRRNINVTLTEVNDISDIPEQFCNDYIPSESEIRTSRARIVEQVQKKPSWYKYTSVPVPEYVQQMRK